VSPAGRIYQWLFWERLVFQSCKISRAKYYLGIQKKLIVKPSIFSHSKIGSRSKWRHFKIKCFFGFCFYQKSTQLKVFMWNHCFHSWQLCVLFFNSEITKKINKITKIFAFLSSLFTVKIIEHKVASYESSDFTGKFLTVLWYYTFTKGLFILRLVLTILCWFNDKSLFVW
jgi:hypothetical protein